MPSVGAHYKFGQITLGNLNFEQKEIINENKEMFDLGLQGPDILFFYKPYIKNSISNIGHQIHSKKAVMFFGEMFFYDNVVENRRKLAYLLGCICHYCLDKNSHLFINEMTQVPVEHRVIEAELDASIINEYNLPKTRYQYITNNKIDIIVLSEIYSMVGRSDLKKSIRDMRKYIKMLDKPENIIMLEKVLSIDRTFSSLCIMDKKNYKEEVKKLLVIFHESLNEAIQLVDEFYDLYNGKINSLTKFMSNFEGI